MAIGDFYKVALVSRSALFGDAVNTFHVKQTGTTPVGGSPLAIATAFTTGVLSQYFALFNGTYVGQVLQVRGEAPNIESIDFPFVGVGGRGGEALPPQCAQLISLRTGLAGRSNRGRMYFPSPSEPDQSDGSWIAAQITRLNDFVTAMTTTFGSDDVYQWVVFSRTLAGGNLVTQILVRNQVRTQRRRVGGVGS